MLEHHWLAGHPGHTCISKPLQLGPTRLPSPRPSAPPLYIPAVASQVSCSCPTVAAPKVAGLLSTF